MSALSGKVVAITGGARGIGEATARALTAAGARVAVGDLDVELAAESAASYGGVGLELDVTSEASFDSFLDQVEEQIGQVDALVNNAGIMVLGRHLEVPMGLQLKQLEVNLRGCIIGCHAVAPRMIARGGGRIINVASIAGRIPNPGTAVYSATKAGVLAFSEGLDSELVRQGVRVSVVLPSFTNTSLIEGTDPSAATVPIEPEEVADMVVSLLRRYRAQAVVPRKLAVSTAQWALVPRRVKQLVREKAGLDTMFTDFDPRGRAGYNARISGQD